jgi:hypothetical protein
MLVLESSDLDKSWMFLSAASTSTSSASPLGTSPRTARDEAYNHTGNLECH